MQSIVVDAGPLIALFRKRDKHHLRAKGWVTSNSSRLVTTLAVVTEACHFLNSAGKLALLTWIRRGGLLLQPVSVEHLDDIERVIQKYAGRNIDFADATLVWLAGLLNTTDVLTIDRSDFEIYRLGRGKPFTVVSF